MGDPGSLPGAGVYLLKMALMLVVVLGLAVGFLYLLRRFVPGPGRGRRIQVVETVTMEPRRSLHLVKIGDRVLLVGSTDGGMSLLAEFTEDEMDVTPPDPGRPRSFLDVLRGRKGGDATGGTHS